MSTRKATSGINSSVKKAKRVVKQTLKGLLKKAEDLRGLHATAEQGNAPFAYLVYKGITEGLFVVEVDGKEKQTPTTQIVAELGFGAHTFPKASSISRFVSAYVNHFKAGFTEEELFDSEGNAKFETATFQIGASRAHNLSSDSDAFKSCKRAKLRVQYLEDIQKPADGGQKVADFKKDIEAGTYGDPARKSERKTASGNGEKVEEARDIDMKENIARAHSFAKLGYSAARLLEAKALSEAWKTAFDAQVNAQAKAQDAGDALAKAAKRAA